MARILANKMNRPILEYNCQNFFCKYIGEGEKRLKEAFVRASETDSILFFDELDSMASSRDNHNEHHYVSLVNALIVNLNSYNCIVIGATNRIGAIDTALLRNNRFEVILNVDYPNFEERIRYLQFLLKNYLYNINVHEVAKNTVRYSFAELKDLVENAILNQLLDRSKIIQMDHVELRKRPSSKFLKYLSEMYLPFTSNSLFYGKMAHMLLYPLQMLLPNCCVVKSFPVLERAKYYLVASAFVNVTDLQAFIEQCEQHGRIVVAFEQYDFVHIRYLFSNEYCVKDDEILFNHLITYCNELSRNENFDNL